MPKMLASMADVSTERRIAPLSLYVLKFVGLDATKKDGRVTYDAEIEIQRSVDGDETFAGHKFHDFMSMHKLDGEINLMAVADVKRYFEAIAPEFANSDDADTDMLKNGLFQAEVFVDEYQKRDGQGQPVGPLNRNNKVNRFTILPYAG